MLRRGLSAILFACLAACATPGSPGGPAAGPTTPSDFQRPDAAQTAPNDPTVGGVSNQDLLAAWADFPAAADPRPIVISEPALLLADEAVHTSVEESVVAGHLDFSADLTADAPPLVRANLPDGPVRLPAGTVEQAIAQLQLPGPGGPDPSGERLGIVDVTLGVAQYQSDRGPLVIPSWLFELEADLGSIGWPAVTPSVLWRLDAPIVATATRSPDERALVVTVLSSESVCQDRSAPELTVLESPSAVVFGFEHVAADTACYGNALGRSTSYTIGLDQPLAGRILVDGTASGAVVAVVTG